MEKNAVIKILSNATMENDELIEVLTHGKYKLEDNIYKATYNETEISGMKGTETSLIIEEDVITLERVGSTSTKMVFKKNEVTVALYNTPYGMLELEIFTKGLEKEIDENGGKVLIEYEMRVIGQEPFKTKINLEIETK
ncbi:DUF1934 domain-containing protein [uncultured Clostridium sp.]|uniref:DUF1934 domain-containing protein n=1 Tax=uncultured Clostridium sp. TaxID=59620 RepID=UPI002614537F|nr:DUF1934 domain-containing protein [uncultured Clostridium sp.]